MFTTTQKMKISCLSRGIKVSDRAGDALSQGGKVPLSIHEYVTTGGITMELEDGNYINAPFDEWYCDAPEAVLEYDNGTDGFMVLFCGDIFRVKVLPLPNYLGQRDSGGHHVTETVMSHTDRIRVSPIFGCAFQCQFCDFVGKRYIQRPVQQMLDGIDIALQDTGLIAKHILMSGGTPAKPTTIILTKCTGKLSSRVSSR